MKKILLFTAIFALALTFCACGDAGAPTLPGADAERNTDAALFTYAEYGEGLEISSVTAQASAQTALTVPAEYNGKAVLAIGASAFKGASALTQVNIYDNITIIKNGAFADCPTLKYVVLYSTPAKTSVGNTGLLEGAPGSLKIWVPASAFSDFSTNYYWGPYSGSLKSFS